MGNRIYGCDDCLAVCPWNRFAAATREAKLQARADLHRAAAGANWRRWTRPAFARCFAGSPIKRIGRDRFVRNVLIAIGNSGDPALLPEAVRLLSDPDDVVSDAAIWAVTRLQSGDAHDADASRGSRTHRNRGRQPAGGATGTGLA